MAKIYKDGNIQLRLEKEGKKTAVLRIGDVVESASEANIKTIKGALESLMDEPYTGVQFVQTFEIQ